jgi:hypothetical protein
VLGAWRNAHGQRELNELFTSLAASFSSCTSFALELQAYDVIGDMAYTAGLEHTSASVNGEPRTDRPRTRECAESLDAERAASRQDYAYRTQATSVWAGLR